MPVRAALQDVGPRLRLCGLLLLDRYLHLLKLELHQLVVGIAVPVVFNEELERLLLATFRQEEARRLWDELYGDEDVQSERDL
jgi:hypothetical protein